MFNNINLELLPYITVIVIHLPGIPMRGNPENQSYTLNNIPVIMEDNIIGGTTACLQIKFNSESIP